METPRQVSETLVAVLIDFENIGLDSMQWLFHRAQHTRLCLSEGHLKSQTSDKET